MRKLSLSITIFLMAGCVSSDSLHTSTVSANARQSIETKQLQLYVLAGRQTNVPGVDTNVHSIQALEVYCGFKKIKAKDTFKNRTELANLKQKTAYATEYNKLILPHCLKRLDQPSA